MTNSVGKTPEEKMTPAQSRNMAIGFLLIVVVLCVIVFASCSNMFDGGGGGGGSDLSDPKWDMYFECTARQKAGGYSVVEAGARCQTLRPE